MGKKSKSRQGEPFVVDLPDGQKLYVADLAEGMALEVATWRGVGEPDSRVARMIVAATREELIARPSNKSQKNGREKKRDKRKGTRGEAESGPTWINYEEQYAESAKEEKSTSRSSRRARIARRAVAGLAAIPVAAAVTAILTGAIALAKPVPSLAAELNLGASSLLIALPQGEYQVGDEVLARVSMDSQQAAVVAQIAKVGSTSVTIASNGSLIELAPTQVIGRLAGTLPIGADLVDRPLLAAAMAAALILGLFLFAL
jgi:hypothetical protein